MFKKPFVVLDLETTGVDPKVNTIIEVALIRYEKGKEVARFESLVKISVPLPRIITAITGLTDSDLQKKGRELTEVLKEAAAFLKGAYLVGHNINFDVGFLKAAGVKLEILGLIDTIPLAQILLPQSASFSLESLADDLGIAQSQSHRAMADTEATLDLFKILCKKIEALPTALLTDIHTHLERSGWEGGVVFNQETENRKQETGNRKQETGPGTPVSPGLHRRNRKQETAEKPSAFHPSKPLDIESLLGPQGVMAQVLPSYEHRPQQIEMAQAVMHAFTQNYHLICEAPTGVGKSMAYLAPAAAIALKNKSKVVISTNTINLQEQLFTKDLPLLKSLYKEASGSSGPRIAMLKGRSHYLCLRRLHEFKNRSRFTDREAILLVKILVWQATTETGDSSEIYLNREDFLIWDFELSADKKYCSPQKCKAFGECYLHKARALAEEADLVITNHALLCADLEKGGGLLPDYEYLVIDEAHRFEEVATDAFGKEVSQESLTLPIKLVQNHLEHFKKGEAVLDPISDLQQFIDNFFSVVSLFTSRNVPDSGYVECLLIDRAVLGMPEWENLRTSMEDVVRRMEIWLNSLATLIDQMALSDLKEAMGLIDALLQEKEVMQEQLVTLKTFFQEESEARTIRYFSSDLSGVVTLHRVPLLIGPHLQESLYSQKKSIVLTSATLTTPASNVILRESGGSGSDSRLRGNDNGCGNDMEDNHRPFGYLRHMLGLDERFEELLLNSPFNFETQAYVLLPTNVLPLTASRSAEQVSAFFAELIEKVEGSLLGLFTSYSAIETLYLNLMNDPRVQKTHLLAQRVSGGRAKIIKAYLRDPAHSALLGTASFWEGVDFNGDSLTTLVIHKLPFDVPSEPIFKARQALFQNPFMEYAVPRAILRFKQGFGRLIRSKKDYGACVVLDNRVTTKDFGELFLKSLPSEIPMDRMKLEDIPGKVKEWLERCREKFHGNADTTSVQ